MKDLIPDKPIKDPVHEERQARLENKFIGSIHPKKGHIVYKYKAGVLNRLKDEDYYNEELVASKKKGKPNFTNHKKIKIEQGAYYLTALNDANAIRKLKKLKLFVKIIK